MIELTRIGSTHEVFWLNPDLVSTVEAHPDTVVTLTTGTRMVVTQTPEEIVAAIRDWRSGILRDALGSRPLRSV